MAKISIAITVEGKRDIQIVNVLSVDDIDNALGAVKNTISDMLKKHDHQKAYQDKYKIADCDIVQDFNYHALDIAIAVRGMIAQEVADKIKIWEDYINAMEEGLVKPSKAHCELLSRLLDFPATHFTSDIERTTARRWVGRVHD